MEEFELQQQQPYYRKLLLGSPMEDANVDDSDLQHLTGAPSEQPPAGPPVAKKKKKRSLPGTPDPSAEVVALSPRTLLATNRFVCEICGKGFQRDQNLQLHRRGHNLPWKLRQRCGGGSGEPPRRRVYVCPESSCVHHSPSRALGDLTGIKKHFCRKHGEKKWKCERCGKRYAVHSDWKAHSKVCGTREYKCDCGTVFSRRDSFVTHRAFCDALAQENNKLEQPMNIATVTSTLQGQAAHQLVLPYHPDDPVADEDDVGGYGLGADVKSPHLKMFPDHNNAIAAGDTLLPELSMAGCMLSSLSARAAAPSSSFFHGRKLGMDAPSDAVMSFPPPVPPGSAIMSATALLHKAAELGATTSTSFYGGVGFPAMVIGSAVVGGGGGLDRLPTLGHHLGPFDVVPALGQTTTATQLVGFDLGGLLPGQLEGGGGTMTRSIGSLMHSEQHVGMVDRRRGEGVRVVDYMGVDDDDQRSFDGVGPFGPHIGPWA